MKNDYLYHYKAKVISVYDADTITVDIDLGFDIWQKNQRVRLARINAPEVRGKEKEQGIKARDWLREILQGHDVTIQTIRDKKGKYGRYLVEVYWQDINVNDALVHEGLAKYQEY